MPKVTARMPDRKVILYIAASLDGFIAGPNDNLSFLSGVEKEGEDYGYSEFIKDVDVVIMGRRTYDWVMKHVSEFPHAGKETYVITRAQRAAIGKINFYTGNLKELILKLKKQTGKHIFVDGGAEIVNELLKDRLIDEFYISIIPILLGKGVRLFNSNRPEELLKCVSSLQYEKGLVQLHYKRADG
jgi:dihydrofolate reductase